MMIEEVFVEAHAAVQFLCPKRMCISPKVRSSRHPVVHEEITQGKANLRILACEYEAPTTVFCS